MSDRKYFQATPPTLALPNLIEVQINSYNEFLKDGLKELFEEISPVRDFTSKSLELALLDYKLDEPKVDEDTARDRNVTYEAPLRVQVQLTNLETGEIREQEVFLGDFPKITDRGTFIINGVERVVVSQLVRSAGSFFTADRSGDRNFYGGKVIPTRGAWLEIETSNKGLISVKIDRKRKVPITSLLRVMGLATDEEILAAFTDVDTDEEHKYIEATLEKDPAKTVDQALIEIYKRIRPGDLATVDNAKSLIDTTFFDFSRFDFGKVGRYKLNQRLGTNLPNDKEHRVLRQEDIVAIIKEVIRLNISQAPADDIDHLKNRRIRSVGELIQLAFRRGLLRVERIIKDRMSVSESDTVTPAQLINVRPIVAATQEFFASSQLSQFMDQTNPLSEVGHKRRLNAMGPGGLTRERASFEVRDVHVSHYGRICPIETPEGPNIGLVTSLSSYARINEYGFIETPYRKVEVTGKKAKVTGAVEYLDAGAEEGKTIAQANTPLTKDGYVSEDRVIARKNFAPTVVSPEEVDYIDVSPKQIVSVTTALIPFLEHDNANRALMGSNMQRQAVATVRPDAPVVGTGIERRAAMDTGQIVLSAEAGKVTYVDAERIEVTGKKKRTYQLKKFMRSNQDMAISQRPTVDVGQRVKEGDVLADGPATEDGEIALGQNLTVAFMPWGGANYEDAVIISERVVREDRYTSVHISRFSVQVRDTKLGPEVTTNDIPNVGAEALKDLDEDGIVRIGAEVRAGDILVGKITPKGETELTAEERLLRAIFGEKARDVKDTSLRLQHGEHGKVVDVKIFDRELGDDLAAGVLKIIEVSVAQVRKIQVGDKMAGRHGNKGVISEILPEEDMPHLADGTPVDIILNPLGVTSRMNLGQILETHLGAAAEKLGYKVATPVFEGVTMEEIRAERKKAGLSEDGKEQLVDGRTGDPFDQRTTVGTIYMLKLHHLVDDKMHSRSTGPYALVTQQPLGGKAMFGGQRFGEMEVWALEAYGAAHTLQEMLTVKSDDVVGRAKTYESIIQNQPPKEPSRPESFRVLVKELQSLGLNVHLQGDGGDINEEIDEEVSEAVDPNVLDVLETDSDTELTKADDDAATASDDDDDKDKDEEEEPAEAGDPLGIKKGGK
ncbi:MAG TPA: DNA-directed RNA polymerase subunit beta [Patescibacteria group bacterium]